MKEKFRKWVLLYADFLTEELDKEEYRIPAKIIPEELRDLINEWIARLPRTETCITTPAGDIAGNTRKMFI